MLTADAFLDSLIPRFRTQFGPKVGDAYLDSFLVRMRPRLVRMLEPLVDLLNEPEPEPEPPVEPDAITPEKDAIVMAAFDELVRRKRIELGLSSDVTESLPASRYSLPAPRMHLEQLVETSRGTHQDMLDGVVVELTHKHGGVSQGTVISKSGRTGENWAIEWSTGPLAGQRVLIRNVRIPGETDVGHLRYREVTESLSFLGKIFGDGRPARAKIVTEIKSIKRERRTDWLLVPTLAGHYGVPDATLLQWLRDYRICPGVTLKTMASQCDIAKDRPPAENESWIGRKLSGRPGRDKLLKVIRELKAERRGDWMLIPTLGGHFDVDDDTIVSWLKFYEVCAKPRADMMASQCDVGDVTESLPRRGGDDAFVPDHRAARAGKRGYQPITMTGFPTEADERALELREMRRKLEERTEALGFDILDMQAARGAKAAQLSADIERERRHLDVLRQDIERASKDVTELPATLHLGSAGWQVGRP